MSLLTYSGTWWAWWSNPAIHIHDEQLSMVSLPKSILDKIDYFQLLQTRSTLGLSDIPDELLQQRPELRSVLLASAEQVQKHMMQLSTLSLDSSILHARAQDWESNYGIVSPETIREIVTYRNDLPKSFMQWQGIFSSQFNQSLNQPSFLAERALLGFAVYLLSYFPHIFKRWALTQPLRIIQWAKNVEPMPLEVWDEMDKWSKPFIEACHQDVYSSYEKDDIEFPDLQELELELDDFDLNESKVNQNA